MARVNSDVLTESDLARIVAERSGKFSPRFSDVLDHVSTADVGALLDRTLLLQAAKLRKIQVPESEMQQHVETMVADIRTKFGTEAQFRAALAEEQLSLEELKQQLLKRAKTDYQVYQLVKSRFSVTEQTARQYEAECAARGELPLSVHLRRLAVPVKSGKGGADKASAEVRDLAARILESGMSFEDGVRKYSRMPGAKEDGGDLGYLSADKLSAELAQATRDLQPGQATAPIVTGGYASIFYVEGKQGARALLVEKKFTENREALLKELRRKANIQVFDKRLIKTLPEEYRARLQSAAPRASQPPTPETP